MLLVACIPTIISMGGRVGWEIVISVGWGVGVGVGYIIPSMVYGL